MRGMESRIVYNAAFSAIGFLAFETARSVLLKAHLERKARRSMSREGVEGEGRSRGGADAPGYGKDSAVYGLAGSEDPGRSIRPDRC